MEKFPHLLIITSDTDVVNSMFLEYRNIVVTSFYSWIVMFNVVWRKSKNSTDLVPVLYLHQSAHSFFATMFLVVNYNQQT